MNAITTVAKSKNESKAWFGFCPGEEFTFPYVTGMWIYVMLVN